LDIEDVRIDWEVRALLLRRGDKRQAAHERRRRFRGGDRGSEVVHG